MRRFLGSALCVLVIIGIGLTDSAAANSSEPVPALSTPSTTVEIGDTVTATGTGFQPGGPYEFGVYGGIIPGATIATNVVEVTASAAGSFSVDFIPTSNNPGSGMYLVVTGPNGLNVSLQLALGPPVLTLVDPRTEAPTSDLCPGDWGVGGHGFSGTVGGYYQFSTASAAQDTQLSQPDRYGRLGVGFIAADVLPERFTVDVYQSGRLSPVASISVNRKSASLRYLRGINNPWFQQLTGSCFARKESVAIHVPATVSAPASVYVAGGNIQTMGEVGAVMQFRPAAQPSNPGTVTFTGQTSGQQASYQLGTVAGTTLLSGQSLADGQQAPYLATATPRYALSLNSGNPVITSYLGATPSPVWSAGTHLAQAGTTLRMQADGDLVLTSSSGQRLWSAGTAGSGTDNRVVLQDDGNLVMRTGSGSVVWSSNTGLVRTAAGLVSHVSASSSRHGTAVYVNGLVQQVDSSPKVIRGAARTVYLQRYLGGRWQTMLSRITDSTGQLAVGFVQSATYQYRLVLAASSTAAGATSAVTVR